MSSPFSNFTDASTANGQALWKQATKPLKNEFSGAKSSYAIFKKDVRNRVKLCMWRDLITYQIDGQSKDLIDNADLIPLATVRNAPSASARLDQIVHSLGGTQEVVGDSAIY